jgi:hypothetical protein
MVDPDNIVATLYGPSVMVVVLSANLTQLTTGLWTITAAIPGDASAGEYTMVVAANISAQQFRSHVEDVPDLRDLGGSVLTDTEHR